MSRTHLFISYCHYDSIWIDRLNVHLKPLTKLYNLDIWTDKDINAGDLWQNEIESAISDAKVVILLISPDFLASDFIIEKELPPLLEKAENEGAIILPLILSPCRYKETQNLSKFQSINNPKYPLISLNTTEQEDLFLKLTRRVEEILSKANKIPEKQYEIITNSQDPLSNFKNLEIESEIELGLIELIEKTTQAHERSSNIVTKISEAIANLGKQTNLRTKELNVHNETNKSPNIKEIKRIANKAANNLECFVKTMISEIPDFELQSKLSLSSYQDISIYLNGKLNANLKENSVIELQLNSLIKTTTNTIVNTVKFRNSIESQSKMTTQFNRARKRAVAITNDWIFQLEEYCLNLSEIKKLYK